MLQPVFKTNLDPLGREFIARDGRKVQLGPLCIEIRSNEPDFKGLRYFPESARAPREAEPVYTLNFCNTEYDLPWPIELIRAERDGLYRANRFAAGYYITDHFGAPAYMLTRGTQYWVYGSDFGPILWPYFVKLLLTLHSMQHGTLHLKAAAVAVGSAATLLVARGGGGKTVMLTQLCRNGARFLSNTHTLIDAGRAVGVVTSMRVRKDSLFGPVIAARQLPEGLKQSEYIADPVADFGWESAASAPLMNICLVDYRGPDHCEVREMDKDILYDYMEQFSLPLNVYGLKEDLLDHVGSDIAEFSVQVQRMRADLRRMIDRSRCYYLSCNVMDPKNLSDLYNLLEGRTVTERS